MDEAQRRALITRYKEGPQRVRDALPGITDGELDAEQILRARSGR